MDNKNYTYPDGTQYKGEWKDNKRHGYGAWLRPDGMKYEGEWENDKPGGQGTLTYPDGRKRTGKWENGKFVGEKQPASDQGQQMQELENENRELKKEIANLKQRIYTLEKPINPDDLFAQEEEPPPTSAKPQQYREKPAQNKKIVWWVLAAALFALVVIIIVVSGGEDPVSEPAATPDEQAATDTEPPDVEETEPAPEPEVEITLAEIGETTSFADWEYKVVDVEYHKTLRDERARGTYVVFMIEVTNNSNMPRQIGRMFQVEDDQSRVFAFDSSASLGHHHTFDIDVWHLEDIGASFTGIMPIAFDIPEDVETLFLYPSDIRDDELDSTAVIMVEVEG